MCRNAFYALMRSEDPHFEEVTSNTHDPSLDDPANSIISGTASEHKSEGRRISLQTIESQREGEFFLEAWKKGFVVKIHGKVGKPQRRLVYINPELTEIRWEKMGSKNPMPKQLLLSDISEIRHGTDPDPDDPRFAGTATLRKSADFRKANHCFSIITRERTLDLEFKTAQDCASVCRNMKQLLENLDEDPQQDYLAETRSS